MSPQGPPSLPGRVPLTVPAPVPVAGAAGGHALLARGGHTRDDYPAMSPEWRKVNLICSLDDDGRVVLHRQPIPPIRPDLLALFDVAELKKYMTGATSRNKVIEVAGPPVPLSRRLGELLGR
jgi:hypothetical protein